MHKIIIKKYSNRRLYNTNNSTYITLLELKELIKAGKDFIVQDAKTAEDLTHSTLVQIIFEQEAKGNSIFQIEFMKDVIKMYDDNIFNIMPTYFTCAMKFFKDNQDNLYNSFNPSSIFTQITQYNMKFLEESFTKILNYDKKNINSNN